MRSFEELAAPGFRVQIGASGHHWLDAECPLLVTDACRIPQHLRLPDRTFNELSAPGANLIVYGGKHDGSFSARSWVEFSPKHGWYGARIEATTPPVPEPASALLIAVGIVCVWLWVRRA